MTSEQVFHVYEKNNQVKAHNLTVDELEDMIRSQEIKLSEHEIESCEVSKDMEGSY